MRFRPMFPKTGYISESSIVSFKMQIPKFYSRSEVGSYNPYFIITRSPRYFAPWKAGVKQETKPTNLTSASNHHTSCHPLFNYCPNFYAARWYPLSTGKVYLCCYWVSLFRVNTTLHHVVATKHIKLCLIFYTNRYIYELSKTKTYLKKPNE